MKKKKNKNSKRPKDLYSILTLFYAQFLTCLVFYTFFFFWLCLLFSLGGDRQQYLEIVEFFFFFFFFCDLLIYYLNTNALLAWLLVFDWMIMMRWEFCDVFKQNK